MKCWPSLGYQPYFYFCSMHAFYSHFMNCLWPIGVYYSLWLPFLFCNLIEQYYILFIANNVLNQWVFDDVVYFKGIYLIFYNTVKCIMVSCLLFSELAILSTSFYTCIFFIQDRILLMICWLLNLYNLYYFVLIYFIYTDIFPLYNCYFTSHIPYLVEKSVMGKIHYKMSMAML